MFLNQKQLEEIRQKYPLGTRICLNSMNDPYAPILPGTEGVVSMIDDAGQIHMMWDNGRSLALIPGEDSFIVLSKSTPQDDLKHDTEYDLKCDTKDEPQIELNNKKQDEQQFESNQTLQMGGMKFE